MSPEELRKAIRSMVADMIPVQSLLAEVQSVDENKRTCLVKGLRDDLELEDVLLGVAEGEGNWNKPKLKSTVLVSIIENMEGAAYVSQFSQVDEVYMNCDGGAKLSLNSDGKVRLNGDSFGPLTKVQKLENNLDQLKQYVETVKAAIGPAFAAVGTGTSASGTAGQNSFVGATATLSINFQNMRNDKVQHGNG